MYKNDGRLPLIYVRGFAGGGAAINAAVDDPFYGFSQGSVHVRTDGEGRPQFHQFESPLLRLMTDHHYEVPVYGDQWNYLERAAPGTIAAATIWIHRFYDVSATTFAENAADFSIENAAQDLLKLVRLVLDKTQAPRVFLVAHSMGGLICRSLIQRVMPELEVDDLGHPTPAAAEKYIDKLFTYATPHGGIAFALGFGLLERARDATRFQGSDIFGPKRMHQYLTPGMGSGDGVPDGFNPVEMPEDGFSMDRLFCLIGSNAADYDVALGLSSKAVGARSDGLVKIENAAVQNAHRAVVHRSHSGRYGIVNSEEGYQNLQRFLFGDLEVKVELLGLDVGRHAPPELNFQLDVGLAIRGLPVLVHEQSAAHHCPVLIERRTAEDSVDSPRPLLTTFLSSKAPRPRNILGKSRTLRHALKLRLLSVREHDGRFFFEDHLEQMEDWQDTLLVDIEPPTEDNFPRAWAAWASTVSQSTRGWMPLPEDLLIDEEASKNWWRGEKRLPSVANEMMGNSARVRLTVTPR